MQFRFVMHPSDTLTAAVSIEVHQYVGSGVKLPAAFPSGQVDAGTAVYDVPNAFPDIIGKIAFDLKIGRTYQHIEAAAFMSPFQTYSLNMDTMFSKTGTGGSINAVVELMPLVRVIGNAFFSSGGGRYIANTNLPNFIVKHDTSITVVDNASVVDRRRDPSRQPDKSVYVLQRSARR